jgi:hypothetical protein
MTGKAYPRDTDKRLFPFTRIFSQDPIPMMKNLILYLFMNPAIPEWNPASDVRFWPYADMAVLDPKRTSHLLMVYVLS